MVQSANSDAGIVTRQSRHTVDETIVQLLEVLKASGVTVFAVIDHSGEAEKVGMRMPNTKLVVFGNPKTGTPIMLASSSAAIDLPLKILVAEDAEGATLLSWNSAAYLQTRHRLSPELLARIDVIDRLVNRVVT